MIRCQESSAGFFAKWNYQKLSVNWRSELDRYLEVCDKKYTHKTKDLIKIDAPLELDFDLLGYIDSGITVNIICGGQLAEKRKLSLPERIVGVLRCKNPRCITSVEQGIQHEFFLADHEKGVYRCAYCEAKYERSNG